MKIPRDVGSAGRALLRAVVDYLDEKNADLEPHEQIVAMEAARTADRLQQLREHLTDADLSEPVNVRLLAEERQQRAALANLLVSKLGLPTGLADETPRARRARVAAEAKWAKAPTGSVVSDSARGAAAARWNR